MQVADRNREARATAVIAVVCLVAQLALAPNVALGNGRANFALVFAASVALSSPPDRAVVAGFLAGLVFDLSTTGPVGLMAFCLTIASFLLSGSGRERATGDLGLSVARFAVADAAVSLVYHLAMLLVGQSDSIVDALFLRAVPTAALTLVAFIPFAWYLCRARTPGSPLGRRGRGSHLSGRGL